MAQTKSRQWIDRILSQNGIETEQWIKKKSKHNNNINTERVKTPASDTGFGWKSCVLEMHALWTVHMERVDQVIFYINVHTRYHVNLQEKRNEINTE